MKRRKWWIFAVGIVSILVIGFFAADFQFGYTPPLNKVREYQTNQMVSFDPYGRKGLFQIHNNPTEDDDIQEIDQDMLSLGREVFYEETFGNEVFLTDIVGMIDGPFTIKNVTKAILALGGKGTNNLQVELDSDITIGDKSFKKGEKINTGIDVAEGSLVPLGLPVSVSHGRIRVGISCAACHASFDPDTKKIIEGAPNADLNSGLLLALSTNSTGFFTHTNVDNLRKYITDLNRTVTNSKGEEEALPDPELLEKAVDETIISWPPGNFDTTYELEANPTQIPDSFTLGDHPYGWSGFAAAGPFNGLTTFSNNVHAQNADTLTQMDLSEALFDIDKEVYIGTILQKAANPKFRYNPTLEEKPSEFLSKIDPNPGTVGVNQIVETPEFPKVSVVSPSGVIVSSPGFKFNEQNNAVSAWQNTIQPPKPKIKFAEESVVKGREVFERANCMSCHAGSTLTNNKVISVKEIGTESSRAKAFKRTESIFTKSKLYSPDTPVPLPENPEVHNIPTDHIGQEQIKLSYAHGDSPGGYKVPSLIGLYWTAPYLHEGGVAVGKYGELGLAGTLLNEIKPEPRNSLRALVDKGLRTKVIEANKASEALRKTHVQGVGHSFWVDETTGFTKSEQDALLDYLLSLYEIE
ncbi:electron transport protein [Cytobacillus suaedae]|nr:electron transport protein [Cytobacillus suaedae]